jgi:nitrite reductase/ring-hydroxylating ferredoxin subunit
MSSPSASSQAIRVGSLDELKSRGCIVVRGQSHPIAVFYHEGKVRAVDNRCPHLGFPLSKGSVAGGILTCHWHHARFDLSSGCTFDLFADDVPTAPIEIRNGEVFVAGTCALHDPSEHWNRRLREGMEQNIWLVIAKSVIAMMRTGRDYREMVREGALFAARNRDGWSMGLQILAALSNLVPLLPGEEQYLALYHGLTRVADDCENQVSRRDRYELKGSEADVQTLSGWLRDWTRVRHRDAAERTLLTAIAGGASQGELAEMLLAAATDRPYADSGHALDFINKSFELLDLVGWEYAAAILPTVVRQLVMARGGEESSAWRHPIDLLSMLQDAGAELPSRLEKGRQKVWSGGTTLADSLRSEDPHQVVRAIDEAIEAGAGPTQLTRSLCYAAAMRIARFGIANEFGDWLTALHTFTYCNSLHQILKRLESAGHPISPVLMRGIFQGAMSVYLDRFLNVPPAALPGERGETLDDEPEEAEALRLKYLSVLDTQQRITAAARVVARYLSLGHPVEPLIAVLARGVLREDANFHTFQMLEAAVQQFREWGVTAEGKNILIALARYSAAHSPTQRAALQTADIAMKLDRGKVLHEEE